MARLILQTAEGQQAIDLRPVNSLGRHPNNSIQLLDKIVSDQKYASEVLKVDSTPTFFLNGEKIKGETSFEEFDKRIKALLKG